MPSPSLNANNKPSWPVRFIKRLNPFSSRIEPELYEQDRKITFTRYGVAKSVGGKFGEFDPGGSQFNIDRPSAGTTIDPTKALANNRGFVYAGVNAKAREVMIIDWRLFQINGKDLLEKPEHEALDLLDTVNDNMTALEFKYLISSCLDLTGNTYIFMQGVKSDLDKPQALHLMPPDKVRPVIDRRAWPHQLIGYRMRLESGEFAFKPYEIIHIRLPNPSNFFEGMSPVQAGAEYIDNDNYAQEFNRKFFKNGARPAGFLESEMVSETQIETLKLGFANMHEGIDNMNRIAVLPKGVKWTAAGSAPKDMDFKNLTEDSKERTLAMFGVSRTILGTAESDTNRATAETADYVFSKRVVKPHMMLICDAFNQKLLPRYGDNLYLDFIDPVPEDRAARTDEMQKAVGSQPILTINEAREQFMGLGPTEGGDKLMSPTTMEPAASDSTPTSILNLAMLTLPFAFSSGVFPNGSMVSKDCKCPIALSNPSFTPYKISNTSSFIISFPHCESLYPMQRGNHDTLNFSFLFIEVPAREMMTCGPFCYPHLLFDFPGGLARLKGSRNQSCPSKAKSLFGHSGKVTANPE